MADSGRNATESLNEYIQALALSYTQDATNIEAYEKAVEALNKKRTWQQSVTVGGDLSTDDAADAMADFLNAVEAEL